MEKKLPSELLKERLLKRAKVAMIETKQLIGKLPDSRKKTPSQRRSELMKKKLSRGVGDASDVVSEDCRNCAEEKTCGYKTLRECCHASRINRCQQCGLKYRFRVIEGQPWTHCGACRARMKI